MPDNDQQARATATAPKRTRSRKASTPRAAQANAEQTAPTSKAGAREAGPREAGPREAGPRKAGPRKAGPRKAGPTRPGSSKGKATTRRRSSSGSTRKPEVAAIPAADPPSVLSLPSHCTIHEAASLRESLLPLLAAPEPVELDAQALEQIDAAGIQVLAAFLRSRRRDGTDVIWRTRSPVLADAARQLGAEALLELNDARG